MILSGTALAAEWRLRLKTALEGLPFPITLATVVVGENPASAVYVAGKLKACAEVGIIGQAHHLPDDASADDLNQLIDRLNADKAVNGILLQLPLPPSLKAEDFVGRLDPKKDVDGLHPLNAGLLAQGQAGGFLPCTPWGCLQLIKKANENLSGKRAVIVGRSLLVGRPLASLLLRENCTVTIIHSRSENPAALASEADILVAATGAPGLVTAEWVKPCATVIDVGITRQANGKLTGDVAFAEVEPIAGAITPVPGGVGPMTITGLLFNTLQAACGQHNHPLPPEAAS